MRRLRGIRTLREFDDKITAYYSGFAGADDYYARAAAASVIQQIAVPALVVHSANDPFIRITPETRQRIVSNPHIKFIETRDGGHCAYIADRSADQADLDRFDGYWAEREIIAFLHHH